MQQLVSFLSGAWQSGRGRSRLIYHAISGEVLWEVASEGLDMVVVRLSAIEKGASALRTMTFIERAAILKAVARHLLSEEERSYALSAQIGTARADSWVDIEGGIGTLSTYASLDSRELPDDALWPEDGLIPLSREDGFAARRVLISKSGVAVHINALNFPCWGMLEKLASTWLGGMPAIIKPATATTQLTQAMVRSVVDSGFVPESAISLICGSAGDLLDHPDSRDVVTFTGSATTRRVLQARPNIVARFIPSTMEADPLGYCVLGEDITPDQLELVPFTREIIREMTTKAGQKCTTIRRIIMLQALVNIASGTLAVRLQKVVANDPTQEDVKMGVLVNAEQYADVQEKVNILLAARCEIRLDGQVDLSAVGTLFPPTLLYRPQPDGTPVVHTTEAFGPVTALMLVQSQRHVLQLAYADGSSPAGTLVVVGPQIACQFIIDAARTHGRTQTLDEESAEESTGHGSPLLQLVHGGPGRAGGGGELGGLQVVKHYIQRTAAQGSSTTLATISKQWVRGAKVEEDRIHPFRKYFEELQPDDSLLTSCRTMTEVGIVNFAYLSSDHLYAHMGKTAATEPTFGERVVRGYFMPSTAVGLFVDAGVGPVIASCGLESSRSIEPVKPGDTIQVHFIYKCETLKKQRSAEERPTGVME